MKNQIFTASGGAVQREHYPKKYHQKRRYRLHFMARKAGFNLETAKKTFYVPQSEVDAGGGKQQGG